MYVNLSYDPEDFKKFYDSKSTADEKVLDVTGALFTLNSNFIQARYLDKDHTIEKGSFIEFAKWVGQLSTASWQGRSIRDVCVQDVSLFWLTGLSVKHDSFHWGQAYFFFTSLLRKFGEEIFDKNLTLIFPSGHVQLQSFVNTHIERIGDYNVSVKCIDTTDTHTGSDFAKSVLKRFIQISGIRGKIGKTESPTPVKKLYLGIVLRGTATFRCDLQSYKEREEDDSETGFLPWYQDIMDVGSGKHFGISHYYNCFPTMGQIWTLVRKLAMVRKQLKSASFEYDGVDVSFVLSEMLEATMKLDRWINIIWLQNFFRSDMSNRVEELCYTDEFYNLGRSVACSVRTVNPNVRLVGVQHALITANNTVYRLTDDYFKRLNDEVLPWPDHFVVWGKYFKDLFHESNSLPLSYTSVRANSDFIQSRNGGGSEVGENILWCTTLKHFAEIEKDIIKELAQLTGLSLIIRLHPSGVLSSNELDQSLEHEHLDYKYSCKKQIKDDLVRSVYVVTNANSSVFIDALLANCKVIRVISPLSIPDFTDISFEGVLHVESSADLREKFEKWTSEKISHSWNNDFLLLEDKGSGNAKQ